MDRWTLAYRRPRANYFRRVDNWEGTWAQALELSRTFGKAHPEFEVWYVPTYETELRGSLPEDRQNILANSGRRVRIRENGHLTDEILAQVPGADEAYARFSAVAH